MGKDEKTSIPREFQLHKLSVFIPNGSFALEHKNEMEFLSSRLLALSWPQTLNQPPQ